MASVGRLERLLRDWDVIEDVPAVMEGAKAVVLEHGLRTGDALQLAAARLWAGDFRKRRVFITADGELADAAEVDGFRVERVA